MLPRSPASIGCAVEKFACAATETTPGLERMRNAATEQMYVKVNGIKVTYDGDLTQAEWQEFSIELASLGINLSNVTSITIGFERIGATGGLGMVFIDDVLLYTPLE